MSQPLLRRRASRPHSTVAETAGSELFPIPNLLFFPRDRKLTFSWAHSRRKDDTFQTPLQPGVAKPLGAGHRAYPAVIPAMPAKPP